MIVQAWRAVVKFKLTWFKKTFRGKKQLFKHVFVYFQCFWLSFVKFIKISNRILSFFYSFFETLLIWYVGHINPVDLLIFISLNLLKPGAFECAGHNLIPFHFWNWVNHSVIWYFCFRKVCLVVLIIFLTLVYFLTALFGRFYFRN